MDRGTQESGKEVQGSLQNAAAALQGVGEGRQGTAPTANCASAGSSVPMASALQLPQARRAHFTPWRQW